MSNRMEGLSALLRTWEAGPQTEAYPAARQSGEQRAVVPPWHPDFDRLVEPGVRTLVACLTGPLGLITYSSCEGHDGADGQSDREVGILPRSAAEYDRVHDMLMAASHACQRETGVEVWVRKAFLDHDAGRSPVIDLIIPALDHAGGDYAARADTACAALVRILPQAASGAAFGAASTP